MRGNQPDRFDEKEWKSLVRDGYREVIAQFGATHTLTFNFADRVGVNQAFFMMKGFCGRVEREALGHWYHRWRAPRLAVVGFPEHLETNPHWHCVVRAPDKLGAVIELFSREFWRELAPGANIDLAHPRVLEAIQIYFTKELTLKDRWEHVFVYAADRKVLKPTISELVK